MMKGRRGEKMGGREGQSKEEDEHMYYMNLMNYI